MTELHPLVAAELTALRRDLTADGTIPPRSKSQQYYDAFRRAFGPEVLRSLSGPTLLERMHAHGNRDSLVYWLEFKDDEEFPARFGSIAGGSALKFGVYRRRETGTWATKGPTSAPVDIRRHLG
jgi:5-methylcytosine-specific restriction enzyme B